MSRASGMRLRPHAKSHKCPDIAQAAGRARRGRHLLPEDRRGRGVRRRGHRRRARHQRGRRAGEARAARARWRATRTIGVLVDDAANVIGARDAATRAGVTLDVYVEVDVGAHRCGVAPRAPAAELAQRDRRRARAAISRPACYHGAAQHLRTPEARRGGHRGGGAARARTRDRSRRPALACADRHRRRHGHVAARARLRRLERAAARLVRLHGRRLCSASIHSPDELRFEQSLFVLAGVMSDAGARARDRATRD